MTQRRRTGKVRKPRSTQRDVHAASELTGLMGGIAYAFIGALIRNHCAHEYVGVAAIGHGLHHDIYAVLKGFEIPGGVTQVSMMVVMLCWRAMVVMAGYIGFQGQ